MTSFIAELSTFLFNCLILDIFSRVLFNVGPFWISV